MDNSKVWVYKNCTMLNNKVCPHCVWLEGAYSEYEYYNGMKQHMNTMSKPRMIFCVNTNSSEGVTVFDSMDKFTNAHLCVLGTRGQSVSLKHSARLSSLLSGVIMWVKYLAKKGIQNTYVMYNSHYDPNRGEKEHLHAFVCPDPRYEAACSMFREYFGLPRKDIIGKKPIVYAPYPTDKYVYDLTESDTSALLTSTSPIQVLEKVCNTSITEQTSFYLFLYYNKGSITGKVSIVPL